MWYSQAVVWACLKPYTLWRVWGDLGDEITSGTIKMKPKDKQPIINSNKQNSQMRNKRNYPNHTQQQVT